MNDPKEIEIILVEDNDVDAELTLRALHKNHLSNQILRLQDGQELIDYLFLPDGCPKEGVNYCPKLILLDLKLPRVSGLEVLRILKNDQLTKQIPVVVLTSSTEDQDIDECYRLGVNSYIVKPVEFDQFMESVQELGFYWLLLNKFSTKQVM
jgi:CheY-like chemotaxis protein